jgi:GNAT superfamily N-acetyltransferase
MTSVRPLRRGDVPELFTMIRELAEFEKLTHLFVTTPAKLEADAFASPPRFHARVAEQGGRLVGYAVYTFAYFTFTGAWIYLDDLYVRESERGNGAGKALLASVADHALEAGCLGIQWFVLDWNERAIRFYEAMGAKLEQGWLVEKVRGPDAIRAFAARLRG